MQEQQIKNIVKSLYKGQMGVNIVAEISCDNNFNTTSLFVGRLKKRTLVINARLGTSYSNSNSYELERNYGIKKVYKSNSMKGMIWLEYPLFKQSCKTNKKYLAMNYRLNDKTEFYNRYYLDNKEISANQYSSIIEKYGKKKKTTYCKKQEIFGLKKEEEQTKVLNYCFDGIILINTNKEEAMKEFNK